MMEKEPSIRLPYVVADFKVHGIPIVFDKEMQWTRAMKYLLTNLKWCVLASRRLSAACDWPSLLLVLVTPTPPVPSTYALGVCCRVLSWATTSRSMRV